MSKGTLYEVVYKQGEPEPVPVALELVKPEHVRWSGGKPTEIETTSGWCHLEGLLGTKFVYVPAHVLLTPPASPSGTGSYAAAPPPPAPASAPKQDTVADSDSQQIAAMLRAAKLEGSVYWSPMMRDFAAALMEVVRKQAVYAANWAIMIGILNPPEWPFSTDQAVGALLCDPCSQLRKAAEFRDQIVATIKGKLDAHYAAQAAANAPQSVPRDYTPPSRDGVGSVTVTVGGAKPACTCKLHDDAGRPKAHAKACPRWTRQDADWCIAQWQDVRHLPTNPGPLPAGTKVPDKFARVEPQSTAAPEPATAAATTTEPWRPLASMHGKAHRVLAEVERSLVELRDLEAQLDRAWRAAANVPPAAPEPAAAPPAGAGREVGR